MSEPERPKSEAEKAVPMPASGPCRLVFRFSRITPVLPEDTSRLLMTAPTLLTVCRRPQNVPRRPRKIEQVDEIARHLAILVEAHLDRIEDRAHGLRRDRHAADAVAEEGRHGGEEHRRALDLDAGLGDPESVHPADFREQAKHLAEGEEHADEQNGDDHAVQHGIGEEDVVGLPVEDEREEAGEDEEDDHPPEIDLRSGELIGIVLPCARSSEKTQARPRSSPGDLLQ